MDTLQSLALALTLSTRQGQHILKVVLGVAALALWWIGGFGLLSLFVMAWMVIQAVAKWR